MPDLPEGASFAVLVNSRDGKWAICDWDADEDEEEGVSSSGHRIEFGERLRTMVYSAEKYPPSLVLGLRAVMDRFPEDPTRESARLIFEEQLAASIYTLLKGQRTSPFVLAEASRGDSIDFAKGEFYWVVGRTASTPRAYRYLQERGDYREGDEFVYWLDNRWLDVLPSAAFILDDQALARLPVLEGEGFRYV